MRRCRPTVRAYGASFPPHQLLEYTVKQGFPQLCAFLGIREHDCPTDFPVANSGDEIEGLYGVLVAANVGIALAGLLALAIGYKLIALISEGLSLVNRR